jgi:Uncharacterized conserved protein
MDFKDLIKQLGDRAVKIKDSVNTEEATKNAYIMPFIQSLGYDVFNPAEVIPEFVADLGIKQGEKVDYAILRNGHPTILIECKWHGAALDVYNSQLFRYFHTTKAKFGLLTNGFEYRFYTDLVEANKMDDKPFFTFNITDLRETQIDEIKKFHKTYYNHDTIVSTASDLKYTNELKNLIHAELNNPSENFVRHFAKQIYAGTMTSKVVDQFTNLTKKSTTQYINDLITDRLKSALTKEAEAQQIEKEAAKMLVAIPEESKVITTAEELEAFYIIKAILRKKIDVERIIYRDAQSYFSVLLDDNNRKPICRFQLTGTKKYITLFDEDRKGIRKELISIDSIYDLSDQLIKTIDIIEKSGAQE